MSKLATLKQMKPNTATNKTFLKSILFKNSITLSPYVDSCTLLKKLGAEELPPVLYKWFE
jgi:hypothetical protein